MYLYCLNRKKQSPIQVVWVRHWSKLQGIPGRRICDFFQDRNLCIQVVNIRKEQLHNKNTEKDTYSVSNEKKNLPSQPVPGWSEINCHVANTGSIFDLVGDRVHGCDISSRGFTRFGGMRRGFGATTKPPSFVVTDLLDKGGGVLTRGTPADWII